MASNIWRPDRLPRVSAPNPTVTGTRRIEWLSPCFMKGRSNLRYERVKYPLAAPALSVFAARLLGTGTNVSTREGVNEAMPGVRWAIRGAAAVVALLVLNFGGWTHQAHDEQYLAVTSSTLGAGRAAATATTRAAAAPTPAARASVGTARWWSGASSDKAANGAFGRWRGEPITIGGTWDNGNADMVAMKTICPGGTWAKWRGRLDVAVGAIERDKGETWAKAATGAYDARWTQSLKKIKQCWGSRDPGKLYIRFAHELNLKDMPWRVLGGEEAAFAKAITRYSDLRYTYLPEAKLVFCPSDGTTRGQGIEFAKLWPGKDSKGRPVFNVYAVDTYNSWVVIHTPEEFTTKLLEDQAGMPFGLERHRQLAEAWGLPFAVAEWSGNGDPKDEGTGADLPVYYQMMNTWFRQHAGDPDHPKPGQLIYEIQFNYEPRFELLPTKVQPKAALTYKKLVWGQ